MHHTRKIPIAHLNPHLTCSLCSGYFVDATTIIECLHSFCKSCIVKYLETNKFCPVCEVQIHKTKPLLHIRSDHTLQAVVYKLVPGLFQHEMQFRKEFYGKNPSKLPTNPQDCGEVANTFIYSSDEIICLSLEYADKLSTEDHHLDGDTGNDDMKKMRYLRCPAAVTVGLLKRLVRGKYGLDANHALDILYGDSFLCDEYSLVDLAYIFDWKRKGPMRLKYRIYQESDMPPSPSVHENIEEANGQGGNGIKMNNDEKHLQDVGTKALTPSFAERDNAVSPDKKDTSIFSTGLEIGKDSTKEEPKTFDSEQVGLLEKKETVGTANGNFKDEPPVNTVNSTNTPDTVPEERINQLALVLNNTSSGNTLEDNAECAKPNETNASDFYKTSKLPPKLWSPTVNRIAAKRTANDAVGTNDSDATPAKKPSSGSSKTPRFFKVRNATQSATNEVDPKKGVSVASVTESPVQEVAVNLTKQLSSPKKSSEKEKCQDGYPPSPRSRPESISPNPARPYSAPNATQSTKISSADDGTAKQKTPSHSVLPLVPAGDDSAPQFRFPHPAWLSLARGARPGQMPLGGTPFGNRTPIPPAHFLTSLMASQSPFSYLSSVGMPLPSDGKKATPSTGPSQHKITGPRALTGFPAPFNAMQQCGFPPGLSALLPLPKEILDSFYPSYNQPRPFTSSASRSGGTCALPKSSPNKSAASSSYLAPIGASNTTSPCSPSTKMTKSSCGQRALAPRRVSAPPPLVPISSSAAPPIRSPPTLLPIKEIVDNDRTTSPASSSSTTDRVTVVESSVGNSVPSKESTIESTADEASIAKSAEQIKEKPLEKAATVNVTDNCNANKSGTSHAGFPTASSETPPPGAVDSQPGDLTSD